MSVSAWLLIGTIALPWLGAATVLLLDQRPKAQGFVASASAGLAAAASLALWPLASEAVAFQIPLGGVFGTLTFVPDALGVCLAIIATGIGSLTVIFSIAYMAGNEQLGRYYALVLIFIGAMAGLVLTSNLMLLFIFWEITAVCSYALISFDNDNPRAVAGGVKALLVTQVGGLGLLIGALIAYTHLGSYDVRALLERANTLSPAALSVIAFSFLVAAAAKSAQVPFYTWLPDAMEAPTPVSALIHAATMVNAGIYLLARFYPAFADVPGWSTAVILMGIATLLLASIQALTANDLKRVLAYSTISQLGYLTYAVGTSAIFASQFHLLSHALFKALLFLSAGALIHALHTRDLRELNGLGQNFPFIRNTFIVGALALIGFPLFNGFFSKELLLEAGQSHGPAWAYLIALFSTGLTALYTARVVWIVFFGAPRYSHPAPETPLTMKIPLALLSLGTLTSWVVAGVLTNGLSTTLPFHQISANSTVDILLEILTSPFTYLALSVTAVGLLVWWQRDSVSGLTQWLQSLSPISESDFGLEPFNTYIVRLTHYSAAALRRTQTGQLNWNLVGVAGGLLLVLILLWVGGGQ